MANMNVVILGGAGDMGGRVVKELYKSGEVNVTVADYRVDRAQKLAGDLGPGVTVKFADANSRASLAEVLRGADLCINCVGPFYRYAFDIAAAAIHAGVNYIDICDDDDATLALLSLDGMARRKNVSLLIGMGWTPGISNLLALHAARQMDAAEEIDMTWVGSASDSEGIAVIKHVLHAVTRRTPMYEDYRWVEVPALTGEKAVPFPEPIGTVNAYYCGHPEPVTLPRFMDGLKRVSLRGYLLPQELNQLTKTLIDLELLNSMPKKDALAGLLQTMLPFLRNLGGKAAPPLSGIRVDVAGHKDGRPVIKSYCAVDSMDRLTGIPPAVAALLVARGMLVLPAGVYAPEGCLDPAVFLAELAQRKIEVKEIAPENGK